MSPTYPTAKELLPHRSPILLVDSLLHVDLPNGTADIRVYTGKKDLFYDTALGGIRPYAAVEIMAQAVGMFASYHNVVVGNGKPLSGKLLSARDFHCTSKVLAAPQEWCVHVQEILRTDTIGSYSCTMAPVGGEVEASVELTVIRESLL